MVSEHRDRFYTGLLITHTDGEMHKTANGSAEPFVKDT